MQQVNGFQGDVSVSFGLSVSNAVLNMVTNGDRLRHGTGRRGGRRKVFPWSASRGRTAMHCTARRSSRSSRSSHSPWTGAAPARRPAVGRSLRLHSNDCITLYYFYRRPPLTSPRPDHATPRLATPPDSSFALYFADRSHIKPNFNDVVGDCPFALTTISPRPAQPERSLPLAPPLPSPGPDRQRGPRVGRSRHRHPARLGSAPVPCWD